MLVLDGLGLVVTLLCACGVLLVVQTRRRSGRWGINFNSLRDIRHGSALLGKVNCPKCGREQQTFRRPANLTEALWGGWTCPNCGTRMDKWGKAKT
jgi:ssDNA-binding Zn-finger/Zn-ribbon topoisomerase 1